MGWLPSSSLPLHSIDFINGLRVVSYDWMAQLQEQPNLLSLHFTSFFNKRQLMEEWDESWVELTEAETYNPLRVN